MILNWYDQECHRRIRSFERHSSKDAIAVFLLAFVTLGAAGAQPYTITDLGTLGGSESRPYGVNDVGQVVGESESIGGIRRAFLWLTQPAYGLPAGMNDLGTLGGNESTAFGINNVGQVVGRADTAAPAVFHAFLWDPNSGSMRDLDLGPSAGALREATAINDFGEIVGRTQFIGHTFFVGFYREPGGTTYLFGIDIAPGDAESQEVRTCR